MSNVIKFRCYIQPFTDQFTKYFNTVITYQDLIYPDSENIVQAYMLNCHMSRTNITIWFQKQFEQILLSTMYPNQYHVLDSKCHYINYTDYSISDPQRHLMIQRALHEIQIL